MRKIQNKTRSAWFLPLKIKERTFSQTQCSKTGCSPLCGTVPPPPHSHNVILQWSEMKDRDNLSKCYCTNALSFTQQEVPKYRKSVLKKGDKRNFPQKGDTVACFYTGKLQDGTVFDTNVVTGKGCSCVTNMTTRALSHHVSASVTATLHLILADRLV